MSDIKKIWTEVSFTRKVIWLSWLSVLVFLTGLNYLTALNSADQFSSETNNNKLPVNPTAPLGMVYVPGGTFRMGNAYSKNEAEIPDHSVTVNPFFIDKYEVTNQQYAQFVKATAHKPPVGWRKEGYKKGTDNHPVTGVNWEDAKAYAAWIGKRLPTEEEWEFAARGDSNYLYPWGNEWIKGKANADGESKMLMKIGELNGASKFGVYDMVGNVWEWTASDFKAYPNGTLPKAFAGKSNLKTIRGGSFQSTKEFATTTYRIGWAATGAENYDATGFRCVKDVSK